MLIKCKECELQVSDKALSCPHCGFPMQPDVVPIKKNRKTNRRKRLPNGFGQISEIKNRNLRNPFRAMVTVGKTSEGRPICKPLKPESYFRTYNDAYAALVEYNKNPYDLDPSITLKELYDRWTDVHFKSLKSSSSIRMIQSCWSYCSTIHNMRACDIRARHIKGCMDEGYIIINGEKRLASPVMKKKIKSMFNMMFDYAVEYEIVDKNYARDFALSKEIHKEEELNKKGHIPYTEEEMSILWDNVNSLRNVDIILIQCYSGWRPQELGLIKLKNVDLKNWTFTGGMKTEAGTNRIVPIHTRIRKLVEARYKEAEELGSKYLLNSTYDLEKGTTFTYDRYKRRYETIKRRLKLNPEHRAHDGRVHFVTMAKKYNVDEYAIKYMVGHSITDVTEKVYTKRETDWLHEEIEKIK